MSLFVMADLHLSSTVNKSMDIFGARWTDYMKKIEKNWSSVVTDDDTVIVPGDITWAIDYNEAYEDFKFIEMLPGKKLLGKGNHDYWWGTMTKNRAFIKECGFKTIDFLYNNAYKVEDYIVCGTRGWYVDEKLQTGNTKDVEYEKIVNREAQRLKMSLEEAIKLRTDNEQILVFFHFPPVFNSFVCDEIVDILLEYNIKNCYFGHIHGTYSIPRSTEYKGINFSLISSDFCNFVPMIVMPIEY
ncbi:MAG: serine/threonine protein phosphatase [Ruminococcaceae bacterium]|nr:serine/threonine protein phosphatase [Oscillospiraceae bacterium]